jgi:hypothetical protein
VAIDRINQEVNGFLSSPEGRTKLAEFGAVVAGGAPDRLGRLMSADAAKWKRVIETSGVKLD